LVVALAGVAAACTGPGQHKSVASLSPPEARLSLWLTGLSEAEEDYVLGRVGEGRSDWLPLVPRLSQTGNAGAAEDLRDQLGLALPRNAPGVLAVMDPKNGPVSGVDSVCSTAFGNNLVQPLPADFAAKSIRAVEAVKEPKLQSVRNRCLATLRRGICTICG
jgi:hypothetical protein